MITSAKVSGDDYVIKVGSATLTLKEYSYEINVINADGSSTVLGSELNELPSDDYWFNETKTVEDDLNPIMAVDKISVDLSTDFADVFKRPTLEITTNVRHRQKK